jgi:tetratricopeptide (TPR) repeat protein
MSTPFLRRYFPSVPAEGAVERFLDNEYQIERIAAGNTDETPFVEYLHFLHEAQRHLAIDNLKAAAGKSKTGAVPALIAVMTAPPPTGTPAFTPTDIVEHDLVSRLHRLRERGTLVENVLTNPAFAGGESQLLIEAARAAKNGMTSTGRDQQEEFKDALGLFREAQEGAIGNRNYVVWFQIGWILWKQGAQLAEAEEAFYQAYRLSAATQDVFYYLSQRHRAYLQFLQNKFGEASDTISRAVSLYGDDPDTLVDAARYASASKKPDDAANLLRKAFALEPSRALTVFADEPFLSNLAPLAEAIWHVFENGERRATHAVARLAETEANLRIAAERAGTAIPLPETLTAGIAEAQTLVKQHTAALSYPAALGIVQTANAQSSALYAHAQKTLESESLAIEQRLIRPRRQIERILSEKKKWKEDADKIVRAAKQTNVNLAAPPKRNLFGKFNPHHATLYENYQTARHQAELNAVAVKNELPVYQAEIARSEEEQARIAETMAWLESEQGKSA